MQKPDTSGRASEKLEGEMDAHASLPKFREFQIHCQEHLCGEDRATLESDLSASQSVGRGQRPQDSSGLLPFLFLSCRQHKAINSAMEDPR